MKNKIKKEGRHSMNATLNTGPQAMSPTGHQTGHVNIYNIFILVNISINNIINLDNTYVLMLQG
jgi:hypothetical protein